MSAGLLPNAKAQFEDGNGKPLVGGSVGFYIPATLTPKDTWQDAAQSTLNDNPIILDARGQAIIWGTGSYRQIVKDSSGNLIWDQITEAGDFGSFLLTDGSNVGMTELQKTYFRSYIAMGVVTLTADTTIDYLDVGANGKVVLAGHNLTIGSMADTPRVGIFDDTGGGTVTLQAGPVRPEWWGDINDTWIKATAALPSTGGTILLAQRTYKPNAYVYGTGSASGTALTKDNVSILGAKMPSMDSTCSGLTGGSILQGPFIAYANNLTISNFGVDCGVTVCTASFSGVAQDGVSCTYPNDTLKAASALRLNLKVNNVIGLCQDSVSAVHSVLLEGFSGILGTGDIIGTYGFYGPVIKSAQVVISSLTAYLNGNQGVYFKSDVQTTAVCQDIDIGSINAFANGPPNGYTPHAANPNSGNYGVIFDAQGGNIDQIQIGQITENGHAFGVGTAFTTGTVISNIQIGTVTTDTNSSGGVYIQAGAGQSCSRWSIGALVGRNAPYAYAHNYAAADGSTVWAGSVTGVNCSIAAVLVASTAQPVIACITADNCAAVYNLNNTGYPSVGEFRIPGTATIYSTAAGGTAPALSNSWANLGGGNENFSVELSGYAVKLRGQVGSGTTTTVMTLPPWARPGSNRRFSGRGANSGLSAEVIVPIIVQSDGKVIVNEIAGGVTNCVGGLSLDQISFQQVF